MDVKSQPLVSVLTPVYNGEKYLAECIESILAQTYSNWDYVIVNNCSKDRSLEIAQHYARQDPRIRVHNNPEFLALMPNWNHMMRQLSPGSKYCKVVHADDWLFPECLAEMVKLAEANPSVGLVGAYTLEGNQVTSDGLPYPSTVVPGREICRLALLSGGGGGDFYPFGTPTSTLIRADLVRCRKTFYNESNMHADTEVCYDLLQDSDFGFVHQVLTYTRLHDESNTSRITKLNTLILGKLITLTTYGPMYLSQAEYKKRLELSLQGYYHFLSQSVFKRKEKGFWTYHREGLKRLGFPLKWSKLARAVIRTSYLALMHHLSYPIETTENLVSFIRHGVR
jgi:glycosyltransferase involved in cell wall biosynthesis